MALKLFNDSGVAKLQAKDGEESITATADGAVKLYYDNAEKLATTSAGVDVTGGVAATTSIDVSGTDSKLNLTATNTGADHSINGASSVGALAIDVDINSEGSDARLVVNMRGSEAMRVSSGGQLLVNETSVYSNGSIGAAALQFGGKVGARAGAVSNQNSTAAVVAIGFANPNGHCGGISTSGTSTTYATSSDYRLKENNTPITNATERVKQLNPIRFNFIKDPDTTVDGFLAHEVAEVVPEAVSGEKDATAEVNIYDEDNNVIGTETEIVSQGIDQAKLVPLLVATIQELEARITALEAGA